MEQRETERRREADRDRYEREMGDRQKDREAERDKRLRERNRGVYNNRKLYGDAFKTCLQAV